MKKNFGKFSKKGFLGPIGDDLPSLIPLIFALIVFFSAFTNAWNVFETRNQYFRDNTTMLELSSTLRGNSFYSGYDKFLENCNKSQGTKTLKFRAFLVPLYTNPLAAGNTSQHFDNIAFDKYSFVPFVNNNASSPQTFLCDSAPGEAISKNYSVRFFPVALQHDYEKTVSGVSERHFFVRPMLLVVIAWT